MKNMLTHVINSVFRNIKKLNKLITLSLIFGFFFPFSITLMGWECNYKSPLLDCQTPSVIELSLPRDEYDFSSHLFIYLFFIQFQFRVICILLQFWVIWYIINIFLYHQKFSKNSKTHNTPSSNRKFKIGTHFYQMFMENILKQNLNMPDITQSIYLLKCEWIYSTIRINRYFKT